MRGKFYKSRNVDMPTMLWFPEVLDLAENYDKWLNNPDNRVNIINGKFNKIFIIFFILFAIF